MWLALARKEVFCVCVFFKVKLIINVWLGKPRGELTFCEAILSSFLHHLLIFTWQNLPSQVWFWQKSCTFNSGMTPSIVVYFFLEFFLVNKCSFWPWSLDILSWSLSSSQCSLFWGILTGESPAESDLLTCLARWYFLFVSLCNE